MEKMLRNGNISVFFIAHPDSLQVFAKHNSKHTRIDALIQMAISDYKELFSFHMLTTILMDILMDIEWNDVKKQYSTLLRNHNHSGNPQNNDRQDDDQSDEDDRADEVDEESE
eukprot:4835882-Pleurochrysis_carterae.AAC.2